MIGKLLDHRYQVIEVLATGGFGETYIAQDTKRPGNPVCVVKHLKPISADPLMFDTAKRLFQNEAETLEKLGNHDQIPRLLAYFDENQEFYLVQEFIEGHPLNNELVSSETWTEGEVIDLLIEVLNILEFVHSQGVIHRDIKPDNIIRRASDNKLVLVDFGAVKRLRTASGYAQANGEHFSATVAIGTPGYMPTEQGQGKPRPNSDIYALGMIAIQALTGVEPMDLQEDAQTGEIIWQNLVPVNQSLAAVLNKMVGYHFKDRYQTATKALQTLLLLSTDPESASHPQNLPTYQLNKSPSLQSRQKTLAVAPVNPVFATPPATSTPTAVPRNSNNFDMLQLGILVMLAGGAAAVTPVLVKNVQNFTTSFSGSSEAIVHNCFVEIKASKANLRSEPNAIASSNIVETVGNGKKLLVTGKRTKGGWVEIKVDPKNSGWIYSDVIKNKEEWVSCLRDKGVAVKTVDDSTVIAKKTMTDTEESRSQTSKLSPSPQANSEKSQQKTSHHSATQILEKAREKYESGELDRAIELVKSIPAKASDFKETADMITQWQQDWAKSEALFNDINKALDNGQWDKVLAYKDKPEKLPNIEYWRNKIEPLFKQAAENSAKQKSQKVNTSESE